MFRLNHLIYAGQQILVMVLADSQEGMGPQKHPLESSPSSKTPAVSKRTALVKVCLSLVCLSRSGAGVVEKHQ